ncbi:hypothetical protein [Streptomyces sp. Tu 6176]|uniref:hypothetical protein n=1 Tax=Streptomyces sp. Tu 6176 TaxID=1470557 RepID=UPI00131A3A1F|nr:hypothetical protein [Streptomyces sp. Tu 6176]
MTRPRPHPADGDADRRLGQHLLAVIRAQDARIPAHRRVPRTAAEMRARLAERTAQMVTMRDDACPLCLRWSCNGTDCPPSSAAPAPMQPTAGPGDSGWGQCSDCGQWFPDFNGGRCSACVALGC